MEDKVLFQPGDLVKVNKALANAPKMLVVGRSFTGKDDEKKFKGIICGWFTTTTEWVTAEFNFKDLVHAS